MWAGLVVVVGVGIVEYSCGTPLGLLSFGEEVLVGVVDDAVSEAIDVDVLNLEGDFLAFASGEGEGHAVVVSYLVDPFDAE